MTDLRRSTLRLVSLAFVVGAVLAVAPFWAPLVLAAWFADLLQPLVRVFQRALGGRRRGATAIVVLLVILVLVPLVAIAVEVVQGVEQLVTQLRGALQGQETFASVLLGGDGHTHATFRDWLRLATKYPGNAWSAGLAIIHASTWVLLSLFVFVIALYTFAAHGRHAYRWALVYAPIPHRAFTRFARAFQETGRGILIGMGGTALIQGTIATIAYLVIGIPRAWLLGPLTAIAALVPAVGTGLVWIPLAIELALTHQYGRAVAITVTGAGVISVIDSFVRPMLTRFGRLRLPVLVVLVSMLGGIAAFGPWGALLGPLVVRMTEEALLILRGETRVTSSAVVLRVGSKRSPRSLGRHAL
jgi:predicted PurR-regulated permease PerM